MRKKNNKITSIKKYRNRETGNIGLLIFGIVFIYILVSVFSFITRDKTAVYEVREGSILKDNACTGLVLREESVVTASESGYVNYYVESGSKIAVKNKTYAISDNELNTSKEATENKQVDLSAEEMMHIQQKVQDFNKRFEEADFKSAATLKKDTTAIIENKTNRDRVVEMNKLLDKEDGIKVYRAKDDGILVRSVDGYEDLQLEDVTAKHLEKVDYQLTTINNNTKVNEGDPVYRLITDEYWKLVIKLDKEMRETLLEKKGEHNYLTIRVRFLKDNETMKGSLEIVDDNAVIHFSNSMVRYASERYLDVELILEDETGLKIPQTAVTEKEFFIVPKEYLTTGGASTDSGVLLQTTGKDGNVATEFVSVDVFYTDEETGMMYLDLNDFKKGDMLRLPDSTKTLALNATEKLQGVYNVNKGYAVFKKIDILCESDEYYIIEEGNSYGLANYDHIALHGDSVEENKLITQ